MINRTNGELTSSGQPEQDAQPSSKDADEICDPAQTPELVLLPLTPEQLARAEDRLLNPAPGSRIEAARKYGVDLTLLVEQLRLTPEERVRKLERTATALERVVGIARGRS